MITNDETILNSIITNICRVDDLLTVTRYDGSEVHYNVTPQEPDFNEADSTSKNFIHNKNIEILGANAPDINTINNGDIIVLDSGEVLIKYNDEYVTLQRSDSDRYSTIRIKQWKKGWYKFRDVVMFNNFIYIATDNTNTYPNQYGARWIKATEFNLFANICELQSVNLSGYFDVADANMITQTTNIDTNAVANFLSFFDKALLPHSAFDFGPYLESSDSKVYLEKVEGLASGSVVIYHDLSPLGNARLKNLSFDIEIPYDQYKDSAVSIILHSMEPKDYGNPASQYVAYTAQSDKYVYRDTLVTHKSLNDTSTVTVNNYVKNNGNIEYKSISIDLSDTVGLARYLTIVFEHLDTDISINKIKLSNMSLTYEKEV